MQLKRLHNEVVRTDWATAKAKRSLTANSNEVLNFFGDDTDIRSIDYKRVMEFVAAQQGKGLSGSTINRKLSALSKLYTVARRHDKKIVRIEIPLQKEGKPRQRIFTNDEANALVDYAWSRPERRDLTVLLMDTGIRPGEIVHGKWTVTGDEITLFDTKNGDDRTLVLTPDAKAAAVRLQDHFAKGGHIIYSKYFEEFVKARKAAGLGDDAVPYVMRHTAITRLAEATDNVILIQKWAGHKNLQTTQRYVKATRKGMENLANMLVRK